MDYASAFRLAVNLKCGVDFGTIAAIDIGRSREITVSF